VWRIKDFESRQVRLDFRSSGQGVLDVTQLVVGGVLFVNAVQLTNWSNTTRLQMIVCESCGIEQCEPGGWLCPRSAGDYAVFVPAFSAMLEGHNGLTEYAPPAYVSSHGTPVLDRTAYSDFRERTGLPALDQLPRLSSVELLYVLQWEAPGRALGRFPSIPEVRSDLVLSTSAGDATKVVARLSRLLHEVREMGSVVLRPKLVNEVGVGMHLDGVGSQEWGFAVARGHDEWSLSPLPGVVVDGSRV
jgi:hypothetical protein